MNDIGPSCAIKHAPNSGYGLGLHIYFQAPSEMLYLDIWSFILGNDAGIVE